MLFRDVFTPSTNPGEGTGFRKGEGGVRANVKDYITLY